MVEAVANQPDPGFRPASKLSSFKVADPQYILANDPALTVEEMENALWQQIGGHEIISIVRRDLVNGTNKNFELIFDLEKLNEEYNPQTILALKNSSEFYFNEFAIKFEKYVPSEQSLEKIQAGLKDPIFVDDANNIFICVADLEPWHDLEIQSLAVGQLDDDIMIVFS